MFLQGLILLQQRNLHPYFKKNWPELFSAWFEFKRSSSNDAVTIALGFALKQPWIDKVVVGVDSARQLSRLVQIEKASNQSFDPLLECHDVGLIDPSKWKIK